MTVISVGAKIPYNRFVMDAVMQACLLIRTSFRQEKSRDLFCANFASHFLKISLLVCLCVQESLGLLVKYNSHFALINFGIVWEQIQKSYNECQPRKKYYGNASTISTVTRAKITFSLTISTWRAYSTQRSRFDLSGVQNIEFHKI